MRWSHTGADRNGTAVVGFSRVRQNERVSLLHERHAAEETENSARLACFAAVVTAATPHAYLPFCLSIQTALSSEEVPSPAVRTAQQLLAGAPLRTRRYHLGHIGHICWVTARVLATWDVFFFGL